MKRFKVECEFTYTITDTMKFEIDEDELEEWGSLDAIQNNDSFYDVVCDYREHPGYDNTEIHSFTIKKI